MIANRSIPDATVIPQIPYRDVGAAADWLAEAFGFSVRVRIANHRVQMNVGDGAIVLVEGEGTASVMVRVADAQAHCAAAAKAGAKIVRQPADYPYGERQYTALDLAGHAWTFSQSIADVDPASWGGEVGTL